MREIRIKTIDAKDQRYPTAGDYFDIGDELHFRITKQKNEDYEFMISIHEQVEEYLTRRKGINEQSILEFDLEWEKKKEQGLTTAEEPGAEPDCPYKREHFLATVIEGLLALEMGIDFQTYDQEIVY
jgi:hypothetical protein